MQARQPAGHRPRKRFGQHFLRDPEVIRRIVGAANLQPDDRVAEIGPGLGALTQALLPRLRCLDVVELDRDLIDPLRSACRGLGDLRIHNEDALGFDFCLLCRPGERLRILGNLPYNISTPLLFHLLQQAHCIHDMWFLLQKEVVDRMTASPGGRTYGRLSVMVQYRCRLERVLDVPPEAFRPPPRVRSAVVHITPLTVPRVAVYDQAAFAEIVAMAFSQRRKTLRNSLRGRLSAEQIRSAGVDPGARAENIDVEGFARLVRISHRVS